MEDDPTMADAVLPRPIVAQPQQAVEGGRDPSLLSARLCVVLAAVLWSSSGFFAKAPTFKEGPHGAWPGPVLAFWRAAFACVVLLPMIRRPQWSWKLLPMTATFALMNYTYLTSMAKGSAANAIWLQCTAPVWVLLVGVFVFRERAIWRDWLLIAFAAVGVGVILHYESQGQAFDAVLWGLASGVFYAGVVLSLRHLRSMESAWLAGLNHLVTAIVLLPFALGGPHFPSGIQWLMLAGFGILQMGVPYVLFARGLKSITGHEASGIGLIEPLLVPVWVYLAWGDAPAWWTLVGGGLILVGLAIRYADWPITPAGSASEGIDPLMDEYTRASLSGKPLTVQERLIHLRKQYSDLIERSASIGERQPWQEHVCQLENHVGHLNGLLVLDGFKVPSLYEYLAGDTYLGATVIVDMWVSSLEKSTTRHQRSLKAVSQLQAYMQAIESPAASFRPTAVELHWLLYASALIIGCELGVESLRAVLSSKEGQAACQRAGVHFTRTELHGPLDALLQKLTLSS